MESKVFSEILSVGVADGTFREDINIRFYTELITRFISSLLLDWAIFKGEIDLHRELAYLYRNLLVTLLI
jgi:hypothetical protein